MSKNGYYFYPPPENEIVLQKIEVVNGTIVVKEQNDFEQLLKISEVSRKNLLDKIKIEDGFKNFSENHLSISSNLRTIGTSEIPDEEILENASFFDLLNADGIIAIGDYTFRLDYEHELLYVIKNANIVNSTNYADFLAGNTSNPAVGSFPTYVDVFAALNDGFTKMPPANNQTSDAFRGARSANMGEEIMWDEKTEFSNITEFNNYSFIYQTDNVLGLNGAIINDILDGKIAYNKYGIFFKLYANEKYQRKAWLYYYTVDINSGNNEWSVTYDATFRVIRGNGTQIYNRITLRPGFGVSTGENKLKKTFYEGVRAVDHGGVIRWDVNLRPAVAIRIRRPSDLEYAFFNKQITKVRINNFLGVFNPAISDNIAKPFKLYLR